MLEIVKTINGVKQLVPLTTDSGQGLPLGAWTSFEDDKPRNGYLKAGTTFNQSDYPALYNMLGTNVVPERFDHDRLGDYESVTLSTNSSNPTVMEYDGVLFGSSTHTLKVYINGELFDFTDHTSIAGYGSGTVTFKKGDNIYYHSNVTGNFKVAYYTHPMFIKAVIGPIEDSAADQVLQQCINYNSPDWANAQSITLSTSDYVVPDDGWIVGTGLNPANSQMVKILINGVTVESSIGVTTYHSLPNIQVKVSKGDIVKLNTGSINDQDFHFVPHK